MRLLTRTFALAFACSLLFVGCDTLNLNPKDELASDQVWNDPGLTTSYLNDVYSRIGWGFGDPMIAGLADEAHNTHGHGDAPMRLSNLSPSSRGVWDWGWEEVITKYQWGDIYNSARDLNTFIANVKDSDAFSETQKQTLLGEAYFLRAYFYHNLMRLYGGIPYVTGTFELSGNLENYRVERNTFGETVDMLVADLDSASARLPTEPRRPGAATKGAAMALKSRVLLHAASDLFHDSPFSGEAAQYVSYTGGNQQDRWQKALDASQAVIDGGWYSLEQTGASPEAYHQLFTSNSDHSGVIWARYFSEASGESHNQSLWVSPNGYNSWSGDTPTQEHVNAYEMADGSDFQWEGGDPVSASEPVDAEDPYANRDPRFYANVHFHGADWRPRPSGLQGEDPKGVIQTGWYEDPEAGSAGDDEVADENLIPGMDTRQSGLQNWNGTKTGYNLRKFVSRSVDPSQAQAYNPWQFIRYAEILLNKAEAAANLAMQGNEPMSTALQAVNKVRTRVGMPALQTSNSSAPTYVSGPQELLEEIRQEREVELAFEEFRYFDVRRWKMAPQVYTDAHKVRVEGHLDPNGQMLVNNRFDYKYNVTTVDNRKWNEKAYFLPIAQDEMNRNPNLVQNPGYN